MRTIINLSIKVLLVTLAAGCSAGYDDYSEEALADQELADQAAADQSHAGEAHADESLGETAQPLFGIGENNWRGCNADRRSDISTAQNTIANNWSSYASFVERETGLNIGNCLENRFKKNGEVHCDWEYRHGCNSSLYGVAMYSSHTAHLCRNFLDRVDDKSSGLNRRASYAALLAHEWGHTCWRNENNADKIDVATFNWYKSRYAVTDSTCISC